MQLCIDYVPFVLFAQTYLEVVVCRLMIFRISIVDTNKFALCRGDLYLVLLC